MLNKEATLATYMDLGRDQLMDQEAQNREYSAKAFHLLQLSGVLLGISVAVFQIKGETGYEEYLAQALLIQAACSLGQIAFSFPIISVPLIKALKYNDFPDMKKMASNWHDYPLEKIYEELGDRYKNAIAKNHKILIQKAVLSAITTLLAIYQMHQLAAVILGRVYLGLDFTGLF